MMAEHDVDAHHFIIARDLSSKIRDELCIVAERHKEVRETLVLLLEHEGFTVVGAADHGSEAIQLLEIHRPDLAVLELRLGDMTGIDVAREAARRGLPAAIVIHTTEAGPTQIREALDAGVQALARKAVPPAALLHAVTAAMAREVYVDPALDGFPPAHHCSEPLG
jgi:two-component system response regulator DesR